MTRIAFTRAWEDDRADVDALAVRPGERVVAIAAAGDVALALASEGAAEVLAADINPAQLHLAALKIQAAAWPAEQRYRWFERGLAPDAVAIYRRDLRPGLTADARLFWDDAIGAFTRGFHDSTGVGRTFNRLGAGVRLLVPGLASDLIAVATPAVQLRLWRRRVRRLIFNPVTDWLAGHTPLLGNLAPNAEELDLMRRGGYFGALQERVEDVIGTVLIREHPWWSPAFLGRPVAPGHGAAWLDPGRASAVAAGAPRIRLLHADLATALAREDAGSIDAATISNVPDWLDRDFDRILADRLARALRLGGRVLVRSVLATGGLPAHPAFERDPCSDDLIRRDRTALYGRLDLLRRR